MPTPPSVQLYTVRDALEDDLAGTLDALAAAGFTRVEPFGLADWAERLAPELARTGLAAPTSHAGFLSADEGERERVFAAAEALGVTTVIDPYVEPARWQSAADVAETARRLNDAAAAARSRGLRVGYHNHAHELEHDIDGRSALEYFVSLLDDDVVLEIDTYWVLVGGADPVALLERLGDRVVAIHVKDGPVPGDVADQTPLGEGDVPVRDILAAAPAALRVVELDDSRIPPIEAVTRSLRYLEGLEEGGR